MRRLIRATNIITSRLMILLPTYTVIAQISRVCSTQWLDVQLWHAYCGHTQLLLAYDNVEHANQVPHTAAAATNICCAHSIHFVALKHCSLKAFYISYFEKYTNFYISLNTNCTNCTFVETNVQKETGFRKRL